MSNKFIIFFIIIFINASKEVVPESPPNNNRELKQAEECNPEFGFYRPGNTYNDPSELIVDTPEECCQICRNETECVTWSRMKDRPGCALKNENSTIYMNDLYDAGVISGSVTSNEIQEIDCYVENKVWYPDGEVIDYLFTDTSKKCCQACLDNIDCYSWYRSKKYSLCVLNSNVPTKITDANYKGGTIV